MTYELRCDTCKAKDHAATQTAARTLAHQHVALHPDHKTRVAKA